MAAEVWIRPEASVAGTRWTRCTPPSYLRRREGAVALDDRRDGLDPSDAGVVAVHDLDLPAAPLGVALVHPEELGGEERGLVAAGAGADLQEDVAGVVRVPGEQEDLELLLDRLEAFGERCALGGGHLVELVAGRERLRQLARAVELPRDLAVLLGLPDDRLELRQRLLGLADGAVILDERRIREAGFDLVVLAPDVFQFFEHGSFPPSAFAVSQTDFEYDR